MLQAKFGLATEPQVGLSYNQLVAVQRVHVCESAWLVFR